MSAKAELVAFMYTHPQQEAHPLQFENLYSDRRKPWLVDAGFTETPLFQTEEKLPADVVALVIAAREVWEVDAVSGDALDKALEKFAGLVPYENEPSADEASETLCADPAAQAGAQA